MAPTLRTGFASVSNVTGPTPIYLTAPSSIVSNDLILIAVVCGADSTPTPPEGFFPIAGAGVTGVSTNIRVYQKIATGSEPSEYHVTAPDGVIFSAGICACHPTSLTYAYAQAVKTSSAASSTNKVWPSVTTVDANELLLCFGGFATSGGSTPDALMTERIDASSATARLYLMTQTVVAAGATGTRTATGTSASLIRTVTIAISETNEDPSPLPRWGTWSDTGSLVVYGKQRSVFNQVTDTKVGPNSTIKRGWTLVAPHPNTRGIGLRNRWVISVSRDPSIINPAGDMTTGKPATLTQSGGISTEVFPFLGGTTTGVEEMSYGFPGWASGDWPVNSDTIVSSPPASHSDAAFIQAEVLCSNTAGKVCTATISWTTEVIWIQFDDNTFWYPSGVAITAVPVLAEIEGSGVEVTEAAVLVEVSAVGVYLTSAPALVEISAVGVFVTSLPVLVELEFEEEPPQEPMTVHKASNAGSRALHTILPTEVSGYALDPEYSWWTIVVPEATENLVINPSFELSGTVGYNYDVGTGWQSVNVLEQNLPYGATRGHNCLKLVGNTLGQGEFYYEGLPLEDKALHVTPGPYTFSVDIYATNPDSSFELEIRYAPAGATVAKRRWTRVGSGWKRYAITYIEGGSADLELVFRDTGISGLLHDVYYLDGWQFEAKAYPTTYCDGDMVGFYDTRPTQSYYWKGINNRSISVRRATTGSGGREVSFSREFGLYTTGIIGLGMGSPDFITQALARGKELFRGSNDVPRDFTITCRLMADSWRVLNQKRNVLTNLIKPNTTPGREPLLLRYQPTDDKGAPYGIPLEIVCAYSSGLQGNITNFYQETLPLQFHASDPSLKETIDSCIYMPNELRLVPMGIVYRDTDMEYQNLGEGGATGGVFNNVSVLCFGYDGAVNIAVEVNDVAGTLTFDGYVQGSNVLTIPSDNSAFWGDMGGGLLEGFFEEMTADRDFGITTLLGGAFTYEDGGGNEWNNIAMYIAVDGSMNSAGLVKIDGLDVGLNDAVLCVENHAEGTFYVGGAFTDEDSVVGVEFNHLIRVVTDNTSGTAFAVMVKGGISGDVWSIKSDGARYIYIGGSFLHAYEDNTHAVVTDANNIIIYDSLEDAWITMGDGVNDDVSDIEIAPDGSVYIVGVFDAFGPNDTPLPGIGKWNGYSWEQPFDLNSLHDVSVTAEDLKMKIAPDGILWFYSRDSSNGFTDVPGIGDCHMFGWRSGIFYAPPYEVEGGTDAVSDLKFLPTGEMLIAFRVLGTHTRVPYLTRVDYAGDADCYPTLVLQSAYPQFIVNHTVNAGIYFERVSAELTFLEIMRIDLSGVRANVFSNLRTDMSGSIQTGATNLAEFRFIPGENRISMFAREHVGVAVSWIVWRNAFWGIDAAVKNELFG